ncbi:MULTISPECIES: hypothetical protein [Flavobacterium]|uniref:hypothetical protein n=1 Tax=Flavobacterium TaxID=237 RepID=UPI001182F8CA|nr:MULTISPECIES: hypothetical protein [Flavobacterium]MCR4030430.1 hypothetical protein [Flavobacterium panacis]
MNIEEFNRNASDAKKIGIIKDCFHHNKNECKGKIKQAHSIQRNGRLSIIESEVNKNLSVYCFSHFKSDEKNLISDLVPLGKKEASTFYGFCDLHDTNLFSPIENFPFDIDSQMHFFLHSYRSFAHSYHKKKEELNFWMNFEKTKFDSIMYNEIKSYMQWGNNVALKELEKSKVYLDNAIENKNWESLEYLVYEKEGLYPFAVSSQMSPKVTYKGFPINNHENPSIPYENPMITFLPDNNSTIVIIAVFPHERKAVKLIRELEKLNDLKLEKAITSLIIANCENTFLSPLFWNKISKIGQQKLISEFTINASSTKYNNKFFISSFNFFDEKYEINMLKK